MPISSGSRMRWTLAESKAILAHPHTGLEATEMGYIVVQNQTTKAWELMAPGGIHLETFKTKSEAEKGAQKREQFTTNMARR